MSAVWLGTLGLGLSLLTAAPPPRVQLSKAVCDSHGACVTLKEEGRSEDGLLLLRLEEKLSARLPEKKAFSVWLAWPRDEQQQLHFPSLQTSVQTAMTTPEGHLELFIPSEVRVRRKPDEPPAMLAHVSFDPAVTGISRAPVHELIAAAIEHTLLDGEQQQKLELRQKSFESQQGALLSSMKEFMAHPSGQTERSKFLSFLGTVPSGPLAAPDAPSFAPETFLTGAQRTALRKKGYEVVGKASLKYSDTSEQAYQLQLQAYSVEQLVREWNAGLRGPAAGLENLPRPPLDFDRAHRLDDVSLTLDVRNDAGSTRMEQVYQRLLKVSGVRQGAGEPLTPATPRP